MNFDEQFSENVDKQIKALQGQRIQDAPVEETKS